MSARPKAKSPLESEGFDETERAAWGGLIVIHGRLMHDVAEDLRIKSGLTHPEFEVLLRLYWSPEHRARIQDLAAASILTASGMSRVVSRLETQAFVVRHRAEEDGRGAYAELTPAGAAKFESAARHHMDFVRENFLSKYTRPQLRQMAELWKHLEAPS